MTEAGPQIAAESPLLTYEQAGARVGMGPRWIRDRVNSGELIGTDLGYNCKRIQLLDLEAFIQSRRTVEKRRK